MMSFGDASDLTPVEIARYGRHLVMPEVTMEGQKRLKAAKVLIVGAGGLGSPIAMYLAAAGVGRIGIVDFDEVDFSNLQRQILHDTDDVGRKKIDSAKDRINSINPEVRADTIEARITSANALDIIRDYDIVIDGTDNFATRYLVNDACVMLGKTNVYGSIFRFEGQISVFTPGEGPCYRCLFEEPPPPGLVPSCAEGGVLGILPGVVGCIQATEVIKIIIGIGSPLIGRLLLFDALEMKFREVAVKRNLDCAVCGANPRITELIDYEEFCGVRGEESATADNANISEISVAELKVRIDRGDDAVILDVRNPEEWDICRIEGSVLIPVNELASRVSELDNTREILVYCKSGVRSAKAVAILRDAGFDRAWIVTGGILAWAESIDPSMPRY